MIFEKNDPTHEVKRCERLLKREAASQCYATFLKAFCGAPAWKKSELERCLAVFARHGIRRHRRPAPVTATLRAPNRVLQHA